MDNTQEERKLLVDPTSVAYGSLNNDAGEIRHASNRAPSQEHTISKCSWAVICVIFLVFLMPAIIYFIKHGILHKLFNLLCASQTNPNTDDDITFKDSLQIG